MMKTRYINVGIRGFIAALLAAVCFAAGCAPTGQRIVPVETTYPVTEVSPSPSFTPSPALSASPTKQNATQTPTPRPTPTDEGVLLRVYKSDRELELWVDGELLHACPVGLGFTPAEHKQQEGDGRTPEGEYFICVRNAQSRFYLSLGVSYPGEEDAKRGLDEGLITQEQHDEIVEAVSNGRRPPWNTPLGGEIMVHGNGGGSDWTSGCIAVDDSDMDVLWEHVPIGARIVIYP